MSDVFNVTASYDKPAYNAGDTITITIAGGDVQTIVTTNKVGPITIPSVAVNQAKTTITIPAETVTVTTATPESVKIDPTVAIDDTSATPRAWTLAPNGLSISSIA